MNPSSHDPVMVAVNNDHHIATTLKMFQCVLIVQLKRSSRSNFTISRARALSAIKTSWRLTPFKKNKTLEWHPPLQMGKS